MTKYCKVQLLFFFFYLKLGIALKKVKKKNQQ